jgi:peptide/nickel transport system substrate-binding protein
MEVTSMKLNKLFSLMTVATVAAVSAIATVPALAQQKVLKVAPHAFPSNLDPINVTAYITRNHGYMIYDTLFGTDEKGAIKPQMVDTYTVSPDKKVYTFVLRNGLEWHDGKPVTGEDVAASIKRWAVRDAFGQKLATFIDKLEAPDAKTFRMTLKEPTGIVLDALGKPSSNVPFIMPKRVAETDPFKVIDDNIGSGPYIFKKDEYKPGVQSIYVKNTKYVPRNEPPNGTTGGKKVFVDRVEWLALKDAQTQQNALLAGEIDIIEQPAFEQYPALRKDARVNVVDTGTVNFQYVMRFNHLVPPFNNVKVREAAMWAMNQDSFLRAQVGPENEGLFSTCPSVYPCGTPLASPKGSEFMVKGNMKKAQELLKASGYDGKPIVVMRPTDLQSIHKLPLVATQLLRQAGFKVDLVTMDWGTLVARRAKKDPADQGGWNIFLTAWVGADIMNPLTSAPLGGAGEKGWAGWATDETLEKLRDDYARAATDADKKRIAEAVQERAMTVGTHAILGEYKNPAVARKNISGLVKAGANVYWNIQKN